MRHLSIDILRTAAIFMMVVVHFVENLSATYDGVDDAGHPLTPWWLPTGLAAPLFTLLTGASYAIWLSVQEHRRVPSDEISRRTVRRGLFLIGLGFAFNIFIWLPEDTFNWDVLTLIGTGMLALAVVPHLPMPVPLLIIGLLFAFAPILRTTTDYAAYWETYHFDYDFTLSDVLIGYLVVGYFPVFPWLLYPIVGFLAGRRVFAIGAAARPAGTGSRELLAIGAGLLAAATVASLLSLLQTDAAPVGWRPPGWTMFPASPTYILGSLSAGFLLLGSLHALVDLPDPQSGESQPRLSMPAGHITYFNTVSRHSLSIYLLHHAVHIWPLWVYGTASQGDPTAHWQSLMPAWASAGLGIIFFAVCGPLFAWLDRKQLPTAESVMRWVCD
jgi:uncharacterized membrane protein